jgi:hypothetical protein
MRGYVSFAGQCPGKHNGPVTFTKTCDTAREILRMDVPSLRCSCGETFFLSPEAIEGIRRQLEAPEFGATASA